MSDLAYYEGKAPFKVSARDEPCETYYKVYGDLLSGPPPLVILHGGPASGHEYLEPYSRLWSDFRIPVVFYDELGCGQSTHLRDTVGDKQFWQPGLFADELESLVNHLRLDRSDGPGFDVFGHSFGGIVAVAFAARRPPRLRRLVLGGASADAQIFKKGLWALSRQLPTVHREAIDEAVETDDCATQAYKDAMAEFQKQYLCRCTPYPHPGLARNRQN
nr:proline iminopeptidase [Quercus suber]